MSRSLQSPGLASSASSPARVTAIAIAGGSGSGKTWLARRLCRRLRPHAAVLSLDDFYRDLSPLPPAERDAVNFDDPAALDWPLLRATLDRILAGEPAVIPRYDFKTHTRLGKSKRWVPRPVVLVEGLWPWARRSPRDRYSLKIFVDGPAELRFARRLARDVAERGRTRHSVRRQWILQSEPMFKRFVRPQLRTADLILPADLPLYEVDRVVAEVRAVANLHE